MDARGFLIGSIIAHQLNKPLILFRKQGKLPADVLAEGYQTEYGEAFLEVHADSLCEGDSVLIFDDLIATGGTCWRRPTWCAAPGRRCSRRRRSSICRSWKARAGCRRPGADLLPDRVLAQRILSQVQNDRGQAGSHVYPWERACPRCFANSEIGLRPANAWARSRHPPAPAPAQRHTMGDARGAPALLGQQLGDVVRRRLPPPWGWSPGSLH
jgi:hypothetical protein